jgi:hypothetical protein
MTDSASSWHEGATGWDQIAVAFARTELVKSEPDYRSLDERIRLLPAEERHAVWITVAEEAASCMARTRAYVEALHNDPDPASVAWGWLDGDFDMLDKVQHVVGPNDPRTAATIEAIRARLGSILEAGNADAAGGTDEATGVAVGAGADVGVVQPPQTWLPTHFVPAGGLPAWDYPDPSRPPIALLNAGLGLVIESIAADWALVRAVNGWRGWVDGRRLLRQG